MGIGFRYIYIHIYIYIYTGEYRGSGNEMEATIST